MSSPPGPACPSVPAAECPPVPPAARFQRFIYTYRIFKIGSKFKIETAEGVQEKIFSTLRDLIVHFEKPNKGLIIPLIYPVQYQRTTCTKRKITIFPEGTYSEIKDEDYVVVLP
ncbi:SH2 domain-containing protein 1B-like isoform X2 [Lissotriton helveticus]